MHETAHEPGEDAEHIQTLYRGLVEDTQRTAAIADDIARAVAAGRNCLVLTRWTEHLESLASTLEERNLEPLMLHGKMGKKARSAVISRLADPPDEGGMLLAATASLLGEGFDCPPLDTLFLAFPIKFKGNVVQYVGRVLRPTDTKTRVEVRDYVDIAVPVLARQHDERRKAYVALGFDLPDPRPFGHHRAVLLATTGQDHWPPPGRNQRPLTGLGAAGGSLTLTRRERDGATQPGWKLYVVTGLGLTAGHLHRIEGSVVATWPDEEFEPLTFRVRDWARGGEVTAIEWEMPERSI